MIKLAGSYMSIQWSIAGVIWTWLFGGTRTPMGDQKDVSTELLLSYYL